MTSSVLRGAAAVLGTALTAYALVGCTTTATDTGSSGPTAACVPSNEALAVGIAIPFLTSPFYSALIDATTEATEAAGGSVAKVTDAGQDAGQQVNDFRTLISSGANAIIAIPVDRSAIQPALEYAAEQGVPVVVVDDKPEAGPAYGVVRANNVAMGESAAQHMAELVPADATVLAINGDQGMQNGRDRRTGFADALATAAPDVTLIDEVADWSGPKAGDVLSTVLSQHPDLAGVYLAADTAYLEPVLAALQARNKLIPAGEPGHVAIVSIDGGLGAHEAIREGFVDAAISQPVDDYSEFGVGLAVDALACVPLEEGLTDHDSEIVDEDGYLVDLLPAPVVTKENVDDPALWGSGQ